MKLPRTVSLGSQIASALRKAILNGDFPPDAELRQERLAEQFGVSRIPVRDALQALERDGLVVLKPNRRYVVAPFGDTDLADHYSVRALVEGEAAYRAAGKRPDFEAIQAAQRKLEDLSEAEDPSSFVIANETFHRLIWAASDSPRLCVVCEQLWTGIAPHTPALVPTQHHRSVEEHRQIITALRERSPHQARAAMVQHILRSSEDLLTYRATLRPQAQEDAS